MHDLISQMVMFMHKTRKTAISNHCRLTVTRNKTDVHGQWAYLCRCANGTSIDINIQRQITKLSEFLLQKFGC